MAVAFNDAMASMAEMMAEDIHVQFRRLSYGPHKSEAVLRGEFRAERERRRLGGSSETASETRRLNAHGC